MKDLEIKPSDVRIDLEVFNSSGFVGFFRLKWCFASTWFCPSGFHDPLISSPSPEPRKTLRLTLSSDAIWRKSAASEWFYCLQHRSRPWTHTPQTFRHLLPLQILADDNWKCKGLTSLSTLCSSLWQVPLTVAVGNASTVGLETLIWINNRTGTVLKELMVFSPIVVLHLC